MSTSLERRLAELERRPRGKEVTNVTGWDANGRITSLEKIIVEPTLDADGNHNESLASIHAKIDSGRPITKQERAEVLAVEAIRIQRKILDAMADAREQHGNPVQYTQGSHNAVTEAVSLLVAEMFLLSGAHSERRQELEQRCARLENRISELEGRGKQHRS